jgi:hypothetical protein
MTILEIVWKSKEGIENTSFLQAALVSGQKTYTYSYNPKVVLYSESHEFNFHAESQPFWISFGHYLVSYIIMSLKFSVWHLKFFTSYRTHCALMSTVCINWLQISTWCVKCLQQWTYTERNVACLMLTHISSQTFLRAICLISVSLNENK